jgi:hypothetical protein
MELRQFWRMFAAVVGDFPEPDWAGRGHGLTTPSRLAFHIIHSLKYYQDNRADFVLADGRRLAADTVPGTEDELPTRRDILAIIDQTRGAADAWLAALDPAEANRVFPWTGPDMASVAGFIIRHSYFHLGELNALLNDSLDGAAADHFAKNIC